MVLSGPWLGMVLAVLVSWLAFLFRICWKIVRQPKQDQRMGLRDFLTLAGIGFTIVAVGSLLVLHLSWISVSVSQHFGVSGIKRVSMFLFWPTLAGLLFSAVGAGSKRFWAFGTCLVTGLWWFSLATTAAISMGAAPIARHPAKYLIPANYVGWIEVRYGAANAPALQMKDGNLILPISPDGLLITSSTIEEGWAKDRYFYYAHDGSVTELKDTGWGKGGMIWANTVEAQQTVDGRASDQLTERFYVGTEENYRNGVSSHETRPSSEPTGQGVPKS
jgi:hypothetical protein